MKQTKLLRRISVAVVAVLLITMSVLSVTLAKYTKDGTLSNSINAATWNVTIVDATSSSESSLTLNDTAYTNVTADRIAPETTGSFGIKVTSTSEVTVNYTITLAVTEAFADVITFYTDAACSTSLDQDTVYSIAIGGEAQTNIIYWKWTGSEEVDDNTLQSLSLTITATVNAEQATPVAG